MPTRTTDTQTYHNQSIQCAKFVSAEPFVWKAVKVVQAATDYWFQFVIKASADATIMIQVGDMVKSQAVTTDWTKYVIDFPSVTNDVDSLYIGFPAGTYWVYNVQLEPAQTPSAWRPAPEDGEDYADNAAQQAVDDQTQLDVFNKLTNNGASQGLYLLDGQLYINGTYIKTGTLDADLVHIINLITEHFRAYSDDAENMIEAEKSYMDLRQLQDGIWKQRIGIYMSYNNGVIRVSYGDVDANGNPRGGDSRRAIITPSTIRVGVDKNDVCQGDIQTKTLEASGNAIISGDLFQETGLRLGSPGNNGKTKIYIKNNGTYQGRDDFALVTVRGGDGRNYRIVGADVGKSGGMTALATSSLSAVNSTWSFDISGLQGIVIIYTLDGTVRQSVTIPYGQIGLNFTWGNGSLKFSVSSSDDIATITLTSVPSGASLKSCWGLY